MIKLEGEYKELECKSDQTRKDCGSHYWIISGSKQLKGHIKYKIPFEMEGTVNNPKYNENALTASPYEWVRIMLSHLVINDCVINVSNERKFKHILYLGLDNKKEICKEATEKGKNPDKLFESLGKVEYDFEHKIVLKDEKGGYVTGFIDLPEQIYKSQYDIEIRMNVRDQPIFMTNQLKISIDNTKVSIYIPFYNDNEPLPIILPK